MGKREIARVLGISRAPTIKPLRVTPVDEIGLASVLAETIDAATAGAGAACHVGLLVRAADQAVALAVAARSRHVSGGWFDEEAEVWDSSGRLVAQSRQLARVGRGRPGSAADGGKASAGQSTSVAAT